MLKNIIEKMENDKYTDNLDQDEPMAFYVGAFQMCRMLLPDLKKEAELQEEMLEQLIIYGNMKVRKLGLYTELALMVDATRELIEKATGKKWENVV